MPDITPATPANPAPVATPAPTPAPANTTPAPANPTPAEPTPANPTPAPANPTPAEPAKAADDPDKAYWPEDWRQKYAKDDPKLLKRLERYASPEAALDALVAAQARINAGGLKEPLKADATPEELAAWRAENGVPDSPDKYEIKLSEGLVIGEADKPFVDSFLEYAHGKNMDSATVSAATDWFLAKQEEIFAAQYERDAQTRQKTFDTLREEMGPGYKNEVKIAHALLNDAPEGIKDAFLGGRLADGTLIGDSPGMIRWLNTLSRTINPVATVVPGSGSNAVQAVEAELGSLRKMMGDNKSAYWKGPDAKKNQARYLELTNALQKNR